MGIKPSEAHLKVAEEAAYWLHRLRQDESPQAHAEFSAWIKLSTVNLQEFLFAHAVWHELDHVDVVMRDKLWSSPSDETILPFTSMREAAPSHGDESEKAVRSSRRDLLQLLGTVAALLLVVFIGWVFLTDRQTIGDEYFTDIGDQKALKLDDGSVVHLNTRSRAEVRYSRSERTVRLLEGEALFVVEHDASRPFYVLTDKAQIRALGTQFNVYRNNRSDTRVAVVQGLVQVSVRSDFNLTLGQSNEGNETFSGLGVRASSIDSGARLEAGDEAEITEGGIVKATAPDIERAVAWRNRKLIFPGDPIGEIVTEFNRYNRAQIRVEGESLAERRMSGVFDADDPAPLIEYLSNDPGVVIERSSDEIVIRLK